MDEEVENLQYIDPTCHAGQIKESELRWWITYVVYFQEGVTPVNVREILHVPELSVIWSTLPHDMTSLMHHVVSALNLIQRLRDAAHSSSSAHLLRMMLLILHHDPPPPDPPPDRPHPLHHLVLLLLLHMCHQLHHPLILLLLHMCHQLHHPSPPHVSPVAPSTDPPLLHFFHGYIRYLYFHHCYLHGY
jgi:hypothetical protein